MADGTFPRSSEAAATRYDVRVIKKPIYDDPQPQRIPQSNTSPSFADTDALSHDISSSAHTVKPSALARALPTPTDRLTHQIRRARLQLYQYSTRVESSVNNLLTGALHLESSFTSTIASLAPPPQAHEPLMPGLVYVLVSTLAGSIISRNRGIFLRATVPVLFGVAAGYVVIPYTMRNVEDLAWRYESKFPAVRDTHLRISERARTIWETGKAHTQMTVARGEVMIDDAREKVESWVKQGK